VVNPQQLALSGGGQQVGISSKVASEFFWGRPLQARFRDTLYRDFRAYVLNRLDGPGREEGFISLDGALRPQLNELKQSLTSAGLDRVASAVDALRPQIRAAVLANMDASRGSITDGVELALLSRELPSRLIAYHTIIQDQQVNAAFELVKGERLSDKNGPVPIPNTASRTKDFKEGKVDGKLVSYDTLLNGQ